MPGRADRIRAQSAKNHVCIRRIHRDNRRARSKNRARRERRKRRSNRRKKSDRMKLATILLIVLGFAAAAAIAYFLYQMPEPTAQPINETENVSTENVAEFGALVEIDFILRL